MLLSSVFLISNQKSVLGVLQRRLLGGTAIQITWIRKSEHGKYSRTSTTGLSGEIAPRIG